MAGTPRLLSPAIIRLSRTATERATLLLFSEWRQTYHTATVENTFSNITHSLDERPSSVKNPSARLRAQTMQLSRVKRKL
jgi:hypothetical protein